MGRTEIVTVMPAVDGGWFWNRYHASPYSGCSYECAYCYNVDTGITPAVADDYLGKFDRDLSRLPVDVITLGDYQPLEKETGAIRSMLKLCAARKFPVHLVERDPLVARDADELAVVAGEAGWSAVSISLLTPPDAAAREARAIGALEPNSPSVSERLAAVRALAENGVLVGIAFMPVIPFIFDSDDNIRAVARAAKDAGARYLIFGDFTLPRPLDYMFFEALRDNGFSEEAERITTLFAPGHEEEYKRYLASVYALARAACEEFGLADHIARPLSHFSADKRESKARAGELFLEARELYLSGKPDEVWQAKQKEAIAVDGAG